MGIEKRLLVLSAQELAVAQVPDQGDVIVRFNLAEMSAALIPELDLALRLSPDEARRLAGALSRAADGVEGVARQ